MQFQFYIDFIIIILSNSSDKAKSTLSILVIFLINC